MDVEMWFSVSLIGSLLLTGWLIVWLIVCLIRTIRTVQREPEPVGRPYEFHAPWEKP
jgi:hypothetical protein